MTEFAMDLKELGLRRKVCKNCPFRRGFRFGSVERAEDFAYMADNPFSFFHCHETGTVDESERGSGDYIRTAKSLECAGLWSMKVHAGTVRQVKGFTPDPDCYEDSFEMVEAHESDPCVSQVRCGPYDEDEDD